MYAAWHKLETEGFLLTGIASMDKSEIFHIIILHINANWFECFALGA